MKSPEKFIHGIQLNEKCLNGVALANFREKSHFEDIESIFLCIFCVPLSLSRQDASFKHPYDYILNYNMFDQNSGKIGRNSKFMSASP